MTKLVLILIQTIAETRSVFTRVQSCIFLVKVVIVPGGKQSLTLLLKGFNFTINWLKFFFVSWLRTLHISSLWAHHVISTISYLIAIRSNKINSSFWKVISDLISGWSDLDYAFIHFDLCSIVLLKNTIYLIHDLIGWQTFLPWIGCGDLEEKNPFSCLICLGKENRIIINEFNYNISK